MGKRGHVKPPVQKRTNTINVRTLRHVHKDVDVVFVSFHVFVLDQPLDLLLDHFLRRQEHVFEDFYELSLELRIGDLFPHFHDLDDSFLRAKDAKLDDAVVVLLLRAFCRQLKTTDQIDLTASGKWNVDVDKYGPPLKITLSSIFNFFSSIFHLCKVCASIQKRYHSPTDQTN